MITIVEGPDCCGKTTLTARLVKEFGYTEVIHNGIPPDGNLCEHYGEQLYLAKQRELLATGHDLCESTIFDRQFLGEFIYGPLMRPKVKPRLLNIHLWNRLMASWDIKLIICLPAKQQMMLNYKKRVLMEYVQEEEIISKIYDQFTQLAGNLRTFVYDWENYDELLEYLNEPSRAVTNLDYIGSPHAHTLFVGEQANSGVLDLPFFSDQYSSQYLWMTLHQQWNEAEIAFTNAFKLDRSVRDFHQIDLPFLETVVALGNKTYATCIEHYGRELVLKAPHPAYWRRFHYKEMKKYAKLLGGIH